MSVLRNCCLCLLIAGIGAVSTDALAGDRETGGDRPEAKKGDAGPAGGWEEDKADGAPEDRAKTEREDFKQLPVNFSAAAEHLELDEETQAKILETLNAPRRKRYDEKFRQLRQEREDLNRKLRLTPNREQSSAIRERLSTIGKQIYEVDGERYAETMKQIIRLLPADKGKLWPATLMAAEALGNYGDRLTEEQTNAVYELIAKRANRINRAKKYWEVSKMRRELIQYIYREVMTDDQRKTMTEEERLAFQNGVPGALKKIRREAGKDKDAPEKGPNSQKDQGETPAKKAEEDAGAGGWGG